VKIAGFILAFYVLLLAAIPCCAIDNCPEDKTEQSTNHEQGDEDCGTCSPFFSCESCAAASTTIQSVQFELSPAVISSVYAGYKLTSLPEAHFDFWQPPKLA
jgi:hypothetical protein